jgi:peptidoglycan/LPS O-acetylase OafA/YrhL
MLPTASRFAYLDGIRALAVLAVICVHWIHQYSPFGYGGIVGVDVFFVLSGFVITSVLWRTTLGEGGVGRAYVVFVARRVRRLYPALLGLCVLGPVLWAVAPGTPLPLSTVIERAALSAAQLTWVPELGGTVMEPFRQTWSLGIEWLFYLTWPVVVLVALARGWSATALARGALVAAVLFYLVPTPNLSWEQVYFLPLPRFGEILVGGALALWFVDHRPEPVARRPREAALAAGLLAVLAAYVVVGARVPQSVGVLVAMPLAALTTALLVHHAYAATGGPLHALLGHRLLAGLGRASYSLYLWHWLPVYLLDKDHVDLPTPVLGLIGVGAAAGLTWLSYVLLERPFLRPRGDVLQPVGEAPTPGRRVPTSGSPA